jgi:valyl-tRNA synthetase
VEAKFDPQAAESRLYKWWRDDGLFTPDETKADAKTYSITIPPPNVTGSLHMGHALCYSIQDILGRWKRMQGFQVLIVPGVDHAGIATQNVVEKEIAAEGLTRHDLGRSAMALGSSTNCSASDVRSTGPASALRWMTGMSTRSSKSSSGFTTRAGYTGARV